MELGSRFWMLENKVAPDAPADAGLAARGSAGGAQLEAASPDSRSTMGVPSALSARTGVTAIRPLRGVLEDITSADMDRALLQTEPAWSRDAGPFREKAFSRFARAS